MVIEPGSKPHVSQSVYRPGEDRSLQEGLAASCPVRLVAVSCLRAFVVCLLLAFQGSLVADTSAPDTTDTSSEEILEAETSAEQANEPKEPAKPKPWYKNFVPIPVIITEPAIGEGLGLGLGYFHPTKATGAYQPKTIESAEVARDISVARKPPPTVTGAFGAVTSNGTYAGGVGHINSFRNDTIRYMGVGAYANLIADFYLANRPFEFNLEGLLIYQDVKVRVKESNWFLGLGLSYLNATNTFRTGNSPDPDGFGFEFLVTDFTDIGLKGRAMYETRDDSLMPNTGRLIDLSITRNDEDFGGSYNYSTYKAKVLSFHQLHDKFVLGLRAEFSVVEDDPPFYAVPWVTLRGIPAMRYQGEQVTVLEVEGRYNLSSNWALVGFGGKGWTSADIAGIDTQQSISAWGAGGRYKLLKDQGVWVGIDIARGPEDTAYYVQVGHPW